MANQIYGQTKMPRRKNTCTLHWLPFVLVFLFFLPPVALAEIRVIELEHLTAAEVLPVVRDLLGEQGRASSLSNRIILNAPPGEIVAIEQALTELDVPRTVLRIAVRQDSRSVEAGSEYSVSGELGGGGAASLGRRIGNVNRSIDQIILVREGDQAFLTVGEQIPYTRQMAVLVGRYGSQGYAQSVDYQRVATGFRVLPFLQGEHVLLKITPRLERIAPEHEEAISGAPAVLFQELTSTVRFPLGQWYDLGSHLERTSDVGRAFLKWSAGSDQLRRQVLLKVEKSD